MSEADTSTAQHAEQVARIEADARYQDLVKRRSHFTWTLTLIMMAVFFGYILLIAFNREFLARPIWAGSETSLGIPLGLGVILIGILLTGVYIHRANSDFDPMTRSIREDAEK